MSYVTRPVPCTLLPHRRHLSHPLVLTSSLLDGSAPVPTPAATPESTTAVTAPPVTETTPTAVSSEQRVEATTPAPVSSQQTGGKGGTDLPCGRGRRQRQRRRRRRHRHNDVRVRRVLRRHLRGQGLGLQARLAGDDRGGEFRCGILACLKQGD